MNEILNLIESVSEGFSFLLLYFSLSFISWILGNPTHFRSIFINLVYVHHMHLFFTRLSFQITLYATETCFFFFGTCSVIH